MDGTTTKSSNTEVWWPSITVAIVTILFGLTALFWPALTATALIYLFSVFIIVHGVVRFISGVMSIRSRNTWWITCLLGLLGIGVGVFILANVTLTLATFILLVGLVLIAQGILEIIVAASGNRETETGSNKALLWVVGLAGILAGIFILMQPVAGGTAFVWILGLYAVIAGILELIIALEIRSAMHSLSA